MKALVVLAHPKGGSLNHAIAARAVETLEALGHEAIFHDLYAEGFDALLPAAEVPDDGPVAPLVAQHCRELAEAEGLVIVHPNWWGMPPAIMKGWIDRVFRAGVAYRFLEGDGGEGVPVGLLRARAALVFNTANTPAAREEAAFGDPLERLWRDCILDLCGVRTFYRRMFRVVVTSTPAERAGWLDEVAEAVRRYFPAGEPARMQCGSTALSLARRAEGVEVVRNATLTGAQVEALRVTVGWDAMAGWYDRVMARSQARFSICEGGELVAFVNVISDGLVSAYLEDLMVRPDRQRQGLGLRLVRGAIAALQADGMRSIGVLFERRLEPFYRACGFTIMAGGLIDRGEGWLGEGVRAGICEGAGNK